MQQDVLRVQDGFRRALHQNDFESFLNTWSQFCQRWMPISADSLSSLHETDLKELRSLVLSIQIISTALRDYEMAELRISDDLARATATRLQDFEQHVEAQSEHSMPRTKHVMSRSPPCAIDWEQRDDDSESDPLLAPYRRWFLEHFPDPYVDKLTRDRLLKQVPHHSAAQCTTWFINARRRSGWGDLFKTHGRGSKEAFARLLQLAESDVTSWQVDASVKDKIARVQGWFNRAQKQVVSEGIMDVVARASEATTERHRRETEAKLLAREVKVDARRTAARRHRANTTKPAPFEYNMPSSATHQRSSSLQDASYFSGLPTTTTTTTTTTFQPPESPFRNISNGSSSVESLPYRDLSGVSRFSVDTESTEASSVEDSCAIQPFDAAIQDQRLLAELPFNLNGDIQVGAVEPSVQQTGNPYYTTLADMQLQSDVLQHAFAQDGRA